jgi:proline iminopeptidase
MKTIGKVLIIFVLVIASASCNSIAPKRTETPTATETSLPTPTAQTISVSEGLQDINGTRLYYKMIGTGDPIIFLHGSGGSHRYFLPYMEQLADSYQLVFYDQRGTGLSDGRLIFSAISIDQFVEDLEALRIAFGFEKISLVGHSRGAIIALSYAFKYQDHLEKLILVDSLFVNDKFSVEFVETTQQRLQRLSPEAQQTFTTTCTRPSTELTSNELADCRAIDAKIRFYDPSKALTMDSTIDKNTADNGGMIQSLVMTDFNRKKQDINAKLAMIAVPTLILHGDFDPIPIASSEYIRQMIPTSKLVIIQESGHFPFVEQPEQFSEAIREFIQ